MIDTEQKKQPMLKNANSNKYIMKPNDKKIMKDFIEKSLKQMQIIDSDHFHMGLIKNHSISSKRYEKRHEKTNSNISCKSIKDNSNSVNYSRINTTFYNDFDPLKSQILERTKGAIKLSDSLKELNRKMNEQQKKFLNETQKINKNLSTFNDKLEKAKKLFNNKNTSKVLRAAYSSKSSIQVIDKGRIHSEERELEHEKQYLRKIERINNCKLLREKTQQMIKQETEASSYKWKEIQNKNYKKILNDILEKRKSTNDYINIVLRKNLVRFDFYNRVFQLIATAIEKIQKNCIEKCN